MTNPSAGDSPNSATAGRPRRGRGRGRRPRTGDRGNGSGDSQGNGDGLLDGEALELGDDEEIVELDEVGERISVVELKRKSMSELTAIGEGLSVENAAGMRKQDLIFAILKAQTANQGRIYAEGVLETLPDGFGFLRAPDQNYLAGPDDIYVSPSQIRRFNLRTGDT